MQTELVNQRTLPVALPLVAALLLVARIVWLQIPERQADDHSLVTWTPIADAQKLSAVTHKPIMYDFTAAWCVPCRQIEQEVFADAQLAARINAAVVAVKVVDRKEEDGVNAAAVASLERRYGVEVFPTLVLAGATGTERQRMEGFRGREAFVSLLVNASRKPLR